jgi:SAM-dependent methyltransferase
LDFGAHTGTLTVFCDPDSYLGVEHDEVFLAAARGQHPAYRFQLTLPTDETFDTIAALAVIEHVDEPAALLKALTACLAPRGRIVLTTPHPRFEFIHTIGARVGLFSHHAHDDHKGLLDRAGMARAASESGLVIGTYKRFLGGANQLFVLDRR